MRFILILVFCTCFLFCRYALKSTPALMIECAVHFEQRKEFDKAVQLYHKGNVLCMWYCWCALTYIRSSIVTLVVSSV